MDTNNKFDIFRDNSLYSQQIRSCLSDIINIIYEEDIIYKMVHQNDSTNNVFEEKYAKHTANEVRYIFINKTINEHVINVIENAYNLAINTRLPIWFDDIVIQSSFEKIGNMTVIHFLRS